MGQSLTEKAVQKMESLRLWLLCPFALRFFRRRGLEMGGGKAVGNRWVGLGWQRGVMG